MLGTVTRGHRSYLPLSGVMKNTREMLIDPGIGLIDIAAVEFVSNVRYRCVQTAFSFVFINTRRFVRACVRSTTKRLLTTYSSLNIYTHTGALEYRIIIWFSGVLRGQLRNFP